MGKIKFGAKLRKEQETFSQSLARVKIKEKVKLMKRIIVAFLVMSLVVGLCACGGNMPVSEATNPIITSTAPTENIEQQLAEENYLKILHWIADNGTPVLEKDDINNYGRVNGYEYEGFSFDVDASGDINANTRLFYIWTETVDSPQKGCLDVIYHILHIDISSGQIAYLWSYARTNFSIAWEEVILAQGEIRVPMSAVTQRNNHHQINDYSESEYFRESAGYTDVRRAINKDLEEMLQKMCAFTKGNIGVHLVEIGFSNYVGAGKT